MPISNRIVLQIIAPSEIFSIGMMMKMSWRWAILNELINLSMIIRVVDGPGTLHELIGLSLQLRTSILGQ